MVKTSFLKDTVQNQALVPLSSKEGNSNAFWINWFIDLRKKGFLSLVCPDVMYQTIGQVDNLKIGNAAWKEVAYKQSILGIITDHSPKASALSNWNI